MPTPTPTPTPTLPADPAAAFASLGDRLVRVWYLDARAQAWSFYDPAPESADFNTLTEVSTGRIILIVISDGEPVEFQGVTLYPGANVIYLE